MATPSRRIGGDRRVAPFQHVCEHTDARAQVPALKAVAEANTTAPALAFTWTPTVTQQVNDWVCFWLGRWGWHATACELSA